MKEINFLGLGFEVGQEQKGLHRSHEHAKRYFPFLKKHGLEIIDQGAFVPEQQTCKKIYQQQQLSKINWSDYKNACTRISQLLQLPEVLLNWGGDHSVALATVGGFCNENPEGYVLWIDAHADLNLPDFSRTGNLHGMPLSILMNLQNVGTLYLPWIKNSLKPQKLIYLGIRDLDPFEKEMIVKLGIRAYTTQDVRRRGIDRIADEILKIVSGSPLHISFDIDSLSPEYAPATGVPVANGLCIQDLKTLGEVLSEHPGLCSMDIVEINPALGKKSDVFQTYIAALIFLLSVLKKGEIYDGLSRSAQAINPAPLESRP